ncbi:hypothetical protein BC427_14340 [Ralstonia solanacearum FJAT-91]|nr:hypothetical protein BC427_14340 [Ralstonia solanacearum FJAT-91]OIN68745.1 hypothetical protein BL248_23150 [Ralstonia solanacearum]
MTRCEIFEKKFSDASPRTRARSGVGTFSIACTSPDSSAAMRVAPLGMKRSVTLSQAGFGPQYWSLRTSSTRSSRA